MAAINVTASSQLAALIEMFKTYATVGSTAADGNTITLSQIENWFTSAKLMNTTTFTASDLKTMFGKLTAGATGVRREDFVKTLGDVSVLLGISEEELTRALSGAPSPSADAPKTAVPAPAASPAAARTPTPAPAVETPATPQTTPTAKDAKDGKETKDTKDAKDVKETKDNKKDSKKNK